jgi:hypothetical protein
MIKYVVVIIIAAVIARWMLDQSPDDGRSR